MRSDEILDNIVRSKTIPRKFVYLEKGPDKFEFKRNVENVRCSIKEYKTNSVEIEYTSETDGFLIFNDAYYPGWKSFVGENEVDIQRGNYLFRTVRVPKGNHMIKFVYDPSYFIPSLLVSVVTFCVMILVYISLWRYGRTKDPSGHQIK